MTWVASHKMPAPVLQLGPPPEDGTFFSEQHSSKINTVVIYKKEQNLYYHDYNNLLHITENHFVQKCYINDRTRLNDSPTKKYSSLRQVENLPLNYSRLYE